MFDELLRGHRRRCTAHTTTSLSEQISLSFRMSPIRPPPVAVVPQRSVAVRPDDKGTAGDAAKRGNGPAAGQASEILAASNVPSGVIILT